MRFKIALATTLLTCVFAPPALAEDPAPPLAGSSWSSWSSTRRQRQGRLRSMAWRPRSRPPTAWWPSRARSSSTRSSGSPRSGDRPRAGTWARAGRRRGRLRQRRLGWRAVGRPLPAHPAPRRNRRGAGYRAHGVTRPRAAANPARPSAPRPAGCVCDRHLERAQRRHEPARDGGDRGVRGHAARGAGGRPSSAGLGRARDQCARPGPLDPDTGRVPRAAHRVDRGGSPRPASASASSRRHPVRIRRRAALRPDPGLDAGRADRAAVATPCGAHRPRHGRDPAHHPLRIPFGVAGDRRRIGDRRPAMGVAPARPRSSGCAGCRPAASCSASGSSPSAASRLRWWCRG